MPNSNRKRKSSKLSQKSKPITLKKNNQATQTQEQRNVADSYSYYNLPEDHAKLAFRQWLGLLYFGMDHPFVQNVMALGRLGRVEKRFASVWGEDGESLDINQSDVRITFMVDNRKDYEILCAHVDSFVDWVQEFITSRGLLICDDMSADFGNFELASEVMYALGRWAIPLRFRVGLRKPKDQSKINTPSRSQDWVYFIRSEDKVKIGTTRNVGSRLSSLQTGSPDPLKLLCVIPGDRSKEKQLHERFASLRDSGEWFWLEGELKEYLETLCMEDLG